MAVLSKLTGLVSLTVPTRARAWALLKIVVFIITLLNIKSWPLMWHGRFYSSLFLHLILRRKHLPKPAHIFAPISSVTRSPFYECDLNLHKSNSSYNSDLDIARTHLFAHLIKPSLKKRQLRGEPLYVALAGVNILFRREIKPFEKFEIISRVLSWDEKWFWVVSHFVKIGADKKRPGSRRNSTAKRGALGERKIFASALSKYVFKAGRITVRPEAVLQESGLLPEKPVAGNTPKAGGTIPNGVTPPSSDDGLSIEKTEVSDSSIWEIPMEAPLLLQGEWTWDRIEKERLRGLEVARHMLALDKLDQEFIGSGTDVGGIGRF